MVYLIHLEQPYRHAQHYIGFVEQEENMEERLKKHRAGTGSAFLRAVNNAGIAYDIARIWPDGDRNFERLLKKRKYSNRICPCCGGNYHKNVTITSAKKEKEQA